MRRVSYLRKIATPAERILWSKLRNRTVSGYKFRRQHPIDRYILDFYCPEARIAGELDGSGHAYTGRREKDRTREAFPAAEGIRVLRFWNDEVRENLDGILQAIWYALEESGYRDNPSP